MTILVLNSGSSSFKFAVYRRVDPSTGAPCPPREQLRGQVRGLPDSPVMVWRTEGAQGGEIVPPAPADQRRALREVITRLREQRLIDRVEAVGHRVVHGGEALVAPCLVDPASLRLMESLEPLAPLHQSHCVAGIHAMAAIDPDLPQVACFDTAFHATQPRLHTTLPLPASWRDRGVRRYGFHGLSFESIAQQLPGLMGTQADSRIVVAHLGSGASICAMRERRSVRTSMSLSTLDGLVMSTRPGAVDIGVALFAQQQLGMSLDTLSRGLYHQSGLLGLSDISGDMRVLAASDDPRAGFAIEVFCQRAAQEIAASAVVLGGCDAIVFTAGIGENDAGARARICGLLGWMGVRIDDTANAAHGPRLHAAGSAIGLWMVPTDEEGVIARHTDALVRRRGLR